MQSLMGLALLASCSTRVPVFSPGDDGFSYEEPEVDGECTGDADCMENGCGNHCTSVDAGSFPGTCEYAEHLDYSRCGCVSGRCRWYLRL